MPAAEGSLPSHFQAVLQDCSRFDCIAGNNNVGVEPLGTGSSGNTVFGGDGGDNNGNNANGGNSNSGNFSGNGGIAAGNNGNGGNGGTGIGGGFVLTQCALHNQKLCCKSSSLCSIKNCIA